MKNKREVYKHLLDGDKIRYTNWRPGRYIHLNDKGNLSYEDGEECEPIFEYYEDWEVYTPPKVYKIYRNYFIDTDDMPHYVDSALDFMKDKIADKVYCTCGHKTVSVNKVVKSKLLEKFES